MSLNAPEEADTCLYHYPSSSLWKIPDRHVVLPATETLIASGDPHHPRWKTPDAGRYGPAALVPFNEIRESRRRRRRRRSSAFRGSTPYDKNDGSGTGER